MLGQHDIHIRYSTNRAKFKVRVQGNNNKTNLEILRTSRQVYVEANPLFWSTNKFMFTDPTAFKLWMKGRTTYEKRLIRSIQLMMHISNKSEPGKRRHNWNNALCEGTVKSLSGLRDLRLRIRQHLHYSTRGYQDINIDYMLKNALLGVERFAKLPLKDVQVSIINLLKRGNGDFPLSMWTTTHKCYMKDVAKTLKEKLLQTSPAITE